MMAKSRSFDAVEKECPNPAEALGAPIPGAGGGEAAPPDAMKVAHGSEGSAGEAVETAGVSGDGEAIG